MKKELTEYNENDRVNIFRAAIAEYRKGEITLDGAIREQHQHPRTFYDYLRRYPDLRDALNEARYHINGTYDAKMRNKARSRFEKRLNGVDKRITKTITIRGNMKDTNEEIEKSITDGDAKEMFEAMLALLGKLDNVTTELKITETNMPPSDAIIVAASQIFDGTQK